MKSIFILRLAAIVGLAVSVASAGPLSPALVAPAPGTGVAGQATLCSTVGGGCNDFIQVDWIVFNDPLAGAVGPYVYYYQLENTTASTTFIDTFSLSSSQWTSAGILSVADLDADFLSPFGLGTPVSGHTTANYGNLATETEPTLAGTISDPTTATFSATSADWLFTTGVGTSDFVRKGEQSTILYATSTKAPKYGNGLASDTVPPSPWVTTNPGSSLLPVPVPEPGFYGLLGIALSGIWLGVTRRRRGASA